MSKTYKKTKLGMILINNDGNKRDSKTGSATKKSSKDTSEVVKNENREDLRDESNDVKKTSASGSKSKGSNEIRKTKSK